MNSADTLDMFAPETQDFIHIDIHIDACLHAGDAEGELLGTWYAKQRPSYIFTGNGYMPDANKR